MYISDKFINHLIAAKDACTVFLISGVKLSGTITFCDDESLTLTRDGVSQLVFRQHIATVMPQDAFSIYDLMRDMKQ